RAASACGPRPTSWTCPRSPGARVTAAGTGRPQDSRARSRSTRSRRRSGKNSPPRPMARRGSASPSGLVLFDKPAGPSSFAIVRDLRERTGARAGHAGTLDPFATGLLLVLLGAFTKQATKLVGLTKRYETEVDLTALTSTGD